MDLLCQTSSAQQGADLRETVYSSVLTLNEFMSKTLNSCQQYQSRCLCFYSATLCKEQGHKDSN